MRTRFALAPRQKEQNVETLISLMEPCGYEMTVVRVLGTCYAGSACQLCIF